MTGLCLEGVVQAADGAAEEVKGGPPAGYAVLVLVAVVEAVEDGEDGDECCDWGCFFVGCCLRCCCGGCG